MESAGKTRKSDALKRKSYSELRKLAKKHGLKGNMKAEKIIAALCSSDSDVTENFSTPTQKRINSSRKNKESKFDEDMRTSLVTPRRGTYSIDIHTGDTSLSFNKSIGISNVTTSSESELKHCSRKMNFINSPKNANNRLRPRTPITAVAHASLNKHVSFTSPNFREKKRTLSSVNLTPHPKKPEKRVLTPRQSTLKKCFGTGNSSCSAISAAFKKEVSTKLKKAGTPNFKKIHERAFERMESIYDYQKRKEQNSAKKISSKPNFKTKVIKDENKIPALFSGIPFIPSTSKAWIFDSEQKIPDFKLKKGAFADAKLSHKQLQNIVQEKSATKAKFDLKSSLSRKLGYKPYRGPVKPLQQLTNVNCITYSHNISKVEPPIVNRAIMSNRLETLSILKGVRTNKRFELQMKNRKL